MDASSDLPRLARDCQILTIAGSDPSGGAGIQADLKVIHALGGYGWSVVTALTAQNTLGVQSVIKIGSQAVAAQFQSVCDDADLQAIKIGMLGQAEIVETVADILDRQQISCPVIVDPVCVSSSGALLLDPAGRQSLLHQLSQHVTLLTPNLPEACLLASDLSQQQICEADITDLKVLTEIADILTGYFPAILIKGGHGAPFGEQDVLTDRLFQRDKGLIASWQAPRLKRRNLHGTGCTLSSAIACYLGAGYDLQQAVTYGHSYLSNCIFHADDIQIGLGSAGVHHFHNLA